MQIANPIPWGRIKAPVRLSSDPQASVGLGWRLGARGSCTLKRLPDI